MARSWPTPRYPRMLEETYPFSALKGGANVLIFPDLNSANIAYKLLSKIGGGETLGPILMGMSKPVHLLSRGAEVEEIVKPRRSRWSTRRKMVPARARAIANSGGGLRAYYAVTVVLGFGSGGGGTIGSGSPRPLCGVPPAFGWGQRRASRRADSAPAGFMGIPLWGRPRLGSAPLSPT